MNLRTLSGMVFPAANLVSMVFLDRRPPDFDDPMKLLRGINQEMQLIKRNRLGLTMVLSLEASRWLPGGIRNLVHADRCSATCVFSNFGTLFAAPAGASGPQKLRIGDLVLQSADALPPVRSKTSVAISAITYAGRMTLALHYDPDVLSAAEAQSLMDDFLSRAAGEGDACP